MAEGERTERVRAHDGIELPVRAWGRGDGLERGVVALHGVATHAGWFDQVADEFARRGIATYAPDRRGSGRAEGLPGWADASTLARDVQSVVEFVAARHRRVVLLCWCWGTLPGLTAAGEGLGVEGLILAAPSVASSQLVTQRFETNLAHAGKGAAAIGLPFDAASEFSEVPDVCERARDDPLMWRELPRPFLSAYGELLQSARQSVGTIRYPMHVILAKNDLLTDRDATLDFFRTQTVQEFEGGHAILQERPKEMVEEVVEWWNGLPEGR
jgi:alpha-beta hydrolase superfamily lysophospholipase